MHRVAELLGVERYSVPPLVARHGLKADGNGRNRRFPRETVETLLALRRSGVSVGTTNQYAMHAKGFGNWLVRPGRRLGENPFRDLIAGNEDADRRHARRELTADELNQLLTSTRASDREFRGLDGEARFVLYATACGTGFRAGGLASLTPESFDLDGDTPTVTLSVRSDKARKGKVQPIPADIAELLRDFLKGKPAGVPIWPGKWASQRSAALMLMKDLKTAGIAYRVDGPDGPEYADFHSLRHTYLTLGGKAGIDLRTLQALAGHSTPELTARYSHRRLVDLAGAVEKMPSILPRPVEQPRRAELAATGTDGPSGPAPVCRRSAAPIDTDRQSMASVDNGYLETPPLPTCHKSFPVKGLGNERERLASTEKERAMGFEPTTSSLGSWHSTTELRPQIIFYQGLMSITLLPPSLVVPSDVLLDPMNLEHIASAYNTSPLQRYRRGKALAREK